MWLPIMVRTDNTGAMFMAVNVSSGIRTRHIDSRYHLIKFVFVKTDHDDSDLFTKNVNKGT
jgi:hypothetical protein